VDPIPNIRFNVAKSLEVISATVNDTSEGLELSKKQIIPAIEILRNDADADVRYFANKALSKANPSQGDQVRQILNRNMILTITW
jgi:serine/threonine-protein phosphatase 2A regulatory subunit A